MIFPDDVVGTDATNCTARGILYEASVRTLRV